MIILGNAEFATGMKLAGLKDCHIVKKREDGLKLLDTLEKDAFIIANISVVEMLPELEEFSNVVSIPDDVKDFSSTDDLKGIIKSAVGIEVNI